MKRSFTKDEFNILLEGIVKDELNNMINSQMINEQRKVVKSIVENIVRNMNPSVLKQALNEAQDDEDEFFAGKDVHGKEVKKYEVAYSEQALSILNDPVINREALADEIEGLNDLSDGSARSYLSKVASGERPLPDDMAKKIVERVNSIGKNR